MKTNWELAKEAINCLLGLGYGPDSKEATEVYKEIDGDFGEPTDSDVAEFISMIADLSTTDANHAKQTAARDGCLAVLRLFDATNI